MSFLIIYGCFGPGPEEVGLQKCYLIMAVVLLILTAGLIFRKQKTTGKRLIPFYDLPDIFQQYKGIYPKIKQEIYVVPIEQY